MCHILISPGNKLESHALSVTSMKLGMVVDMDNTNLFRDGTTLAPPPGGWWRHLQVGHLTGGGACHKIDCQIFLNQLF